MPGTCTLHSDVTDSIDLDDLTPAERRALRLKQKEKEDKDDLKIIDDED